VPVEQQIQPEDEAFLFIAPISGGSGSGGKLYSSGFAPVVLLNPCLEDVSIIGIGYAGRQLRVASSARLNPATISDRNSPIAAIPLLAGLARNRPRLPADYRTA